MIALDEDGPTQADDIIGYTKIDIDTKLGNKMEIEQDMEIKLDPGLNAIGVSKTNARIQSAWD